MDRAREYLEHGLTFAENFCETIVDVLAERLCVTGFSTKDNRLDAWIQDEVWQRNRLDALQGDVHTTALVKGDAYVIVDWEEPGRPVVAFNRPEIIQVRYSDDGRSILWAAKVWNTDTPGPLNEKGRPITRLNVYFPGRVEKWFRLSSSGRHAWQHWLSEEDGRVSDESWRVWWTDTGDEDGQPLGVPVIHFRNRPLGRDTGRSEIRPVIPQNDLLNKLVIDMAMILDNQAWRQRWVKGVDPTNVRFDNVPGDVWIASSPEAAFGDFASDDAGGVLAAIEATLSRMARRSRTPLHLLTGGDMPSGEALRSAEAGLVSRARDRMVSFGNAWEDAVRMALRLASVFGDLDVPDLDSLVIRTEWDDPLSRNELQEAQTLTLHHELGVSKRTIIRRLGYDPDAEEEQRREEQESAADVFERTLDRGGFAGGVAASQEPTGQEAAA
jgi:hypothetical protein